MKCAVCGAEMLNKELTQGHADNCAELRKVLRAALDWNYEYKAINSLCGGNPHWVDWAERVLALAKIEAAKRQP